MPYFGRFRGWRRTRPFWAGLLGIAAGAEILAISAPAARFLVIGKPGIAIPAMVGAAIVGAGVLQWTWPHRSRAIGLVIILLGFASYLLANLGGFGLGMLLALVAGSLGVSWRRPPTPPTQHCARLAD